MTMIARTVSVNTPYLIGDLLISSEIPTTSFESPTQIPLEHLEANHSDDLFPKEFYQKIYIIRDHICIGMAGWVSEMKAFLKEFRLKCSSYEKPGVPLDHETVMEIIRNYDLVNNYANSSLYLLIMLERDGESQNSSEFFWGQWLGLKTEHFGEVMATGSGSIDFLKKLAEPVTWEACEDPFRRAMSHNLCLIARWLTREGTTGETIQNYWGGGFESIFWNSRHFEKIDKVAFLICRGMYTPGEKFLPAPQVVNYYVYHNESLFIISLQIISFTIETKNDLVRFESNVLKRDLYLIPALDLLPGLVEAPSFSFNTESVAAGFDIRYQDQNFFDPCLYINHPDLSVEYDHKTGKLTVVMTKEFNGRLEDGAARYFKIGPA